MSSERTFFRSIATLALTTGVILLIPLVAMQFSGEVAWSLADFIIAGTLLFGAGLSYLLITRKSGNIAYQVAVGVTLATALFLLWTNLAVGLVGSEDNPFNLVYFGVLGVGIIGSFLARFQSQAMERTLFATAAAQALVAFIALILGEHHSPVSSVTEIVMVNGFFVFLWIVSGMLFRHAAREQDSSFE